MLGFRRCWWLTWLFVLGCAPSVPLRIEFRAQVGDAPLVLGQRYVGLVPDARALTLSELRMYVSQLRWIDADGREEDVTLVTREAQSPTLALLDFGASAQAVVHGLQREADIRRHVGLSFELGVPFLYNHADASLADAPLDVSRMFWVWRNGYKFLRLEAQREEPTGAAPLSFHLGSTGCVARSPTAPATTCAHPNRVRVRLPRFDAQHDRVVVDVGRLLASLAVPSSDPVPGCESSPDDADCKGVFSALGLAGAQAQQLFRAARRTP